MATKVSPPSISPDSLLHPSPSSFTKTMSSRPTSAESPPPDEEGPGLCTKELVYEVKPRFKRKPKESVSLPQGAHEVVFSLTIAVAVPIVLDDELFNGAEVGKKMNYYHLQYKLFPDEKEVTKLDLVVYGNEFAKLFPHNGDVKSIKTFCDGDEVWTIWQHNISTPVTDELLQQLCSFKLEVKIWDAKDKCSSKARYDRTKSIRQPTSRVGRDERLYGVRGALIRLSKFYDKKIPTRAWLTRPLPHESIAVRDDTHVLNSQQSQSRKTRSRKSMKSSQKQKKEDFSLYAIPKNDTTDKATFAMLQKLAGPGVPDADDFKKLNQRRVSDAVSKRRSSQPNALANQPLREEDETLDDRSNMDQTNREFGDNLEGFDGDNDEEVVKKTKKHHSQEWEKNGRAKISLNLAGLFSTENIIERLADPVENIEDVFVMVSVSEPLLSDDQKERLNPLIIRVKSVQNLPADPYNLDFLLHNCEYVYCQYKFFDQPMHVTAGRPHSDKVVWDDIQVILVGMFDKIELMEFFSGPDLQFEIHDRDHKPEEEPLKPALFGNDLEDEKISNVSLVSAKRTLYKTFGDRVKAWDPYGIAKIDLSDFLRGQKLIEFEVPVLKCDLPDPLGSQPDKDNKVMGIQGCIDGPTQGPLESGDYIEKGTTLKIAVRLSTALDSSHFPTANFNRLIVEFPYKNVQLLHKLQRLILQTNADTFGLSHLTQGIATLLTTRKLSNLDRTSSTFNAITGFHLADGFRHVFVLEGLQSGGIKYLWDNLQPQHTGDNIRLFYNQEVTFNSRIYPDLAVDFPCIRLHNQLEAILEQSMFYVRDVVPKDSFLGLTKLCSLLQAENLLAVVKGNYFPTEEMLLSVSKQFSVPMTIDEMISMHTPDIYVDRERPYSHKSSATASSATSKNTPSRVDCFNEEGYKQLLVKRSQSNVDFIQENVKSVHVKSNFVRSQRAKSSPIRKVTSSAKPVYNYSNQALNSSDLANAKIRERMSPKKRYTYIPQFHHSGSVVPIDLKEELKKSEEERKARNMSANGWTYIGRKSSMSSNQHPKKLDDASLDELNEEWRENKLHAAQLQPTVPGREHFKWEERQKDMNLYFASTGEFVKEDCTIFSAGDTKDAEWKMKLEKEHQNWAEKLMVDNLTVQTHRRLPQTENTNTGFKASNQLDKLQGMLKDPAVKYGLIYPGSRPVPALDVHRTVKSAKDEFSSFMPGDNYKRTLSTNHLARSEHGRGFQLVCKEKSVVYKRRIGSPMTDMEKRNHLFRTAVGFMNLPKMTESIKGQEKYIPTAACS